VIVLGVRRRCGCVGNINITMSLLRHDECSIQVNTRLDTLPLNLYTKLLQQSELLTQTATGVSSEAPHF